MLYNEKELKKRVDNGCGIFCFFGPEEVLVQDAANKTMAALGDLDPERTTLEGPTPSVEEIIMAAGTISFYGGRRLVYMPMMRPSTYSDKDLEELCSALADCENAVFVITVVVAETWGKLKPGKREQKVITACEKAGYSVQLMRPSRAGLQTLVREWASDLGASFAPGADSELIDRCNEDQFLLRTEVEKLAAMAGYGTITREIVQKGGSIKLDAEAFGMIKLLNSGRTTQALAKLKQLLQMQNEPIMIAGALFSNYQDMYRTSLAARSHRTLQNVAKDFGYTGNWSRRLENAQSAASRMSAAQMRQCILVLTQLDDDLKGSYVDGEILMQQALCELALIRNGK